MAGMIGVVYGTTSELIKLSPVLVRLRDKGAPAMTLCTGQHVQQIPALLDDLALPHPDLWLSRGHRGRDLERMADVPRWFAGIVATFSRHGRAVRAHLTTADARPLLIVHGDTLTTVVGALLGRILRVQVAHVEGGMRSGDWLNPFPEELDRHLASWLAGTHYAPGAEAVANLRRARVHGEIVDTGANTFRDAIRAVPPTPLDIELPAEPFGLVSIHRFELLVRPNTLRAVLERLREASRSMPILFINHPVTEAAVATHGFSSMFDERFRPIPRQRYFAFISLLKASTFIVTDSGGTQQECALLGHPCLVHRTLTEYEDGMDGCVVLSHLDLDVVSEFLSSAAQYARPPKEDGQVPSDVIVEHLERRGYVTSLASG
jgi:UDP-N-acetylglucosamine 2-epimerase (non-hydrolysing)